MTAAVGELLRFWRGERGLSQLALSLDSGISQRHLSFVESGRSVPSRTLVLRLAEVLEVPLRERNALLLAAGYAPGYGEEALDGPEMAMVLRAVEQMLRQQEPHPALLLDRHWNVLRVNEAAPRLFGRFVDLAQWPRPRNLLHLMLSPEGVRPYVERWEKVAAALLGRVRREALGRVLDAGTTALLEAVGRYPGVSALQAVVRPQGAVVPITFCRDGERWSYFSLVTTVGTPTSVTAQELRVECMFPVEG